MARRLSSPARTADRLLAAFFAAVGRLDKSIDPRVNIAKLRAHKWTFSDTIYIFHILLATFWLVIMQKPGFPLKLFIPILYVAALLVPFTSQFFIPATPVFSYLISFWSSQFIPEQFRPTISVSLLPTLESVLYGANISDILTRYTHPVLDIIAWIPYGVLHYTLPFVVAAFIWLFRPKEVLHYYAYAFGHMNLIGVLVQDILPCAAPWYELIYGLTPATYAVRGSAGGLARIDALFGSTGYQVAFGSSPVVFGAFPSLHAACATMEALFWSHFFPQTKVYAWAYAGVLYWATMYLTHHYLIDVVGGACLATACFYLYMPEELRYPANATAGPGSVAGRTRSKHDLYDLEAPRVRRGVSIAADTDLSSETSSTRNSEEQDITYRSPNPATAANGEGTPTSAAPLIAPAPGGKAKKSHRHTASIASLIRAEDRSEEGWSPIGGRGFVFPPTPSRMEMGEGGSERERKQRDS